MPINFLSYPYESFATVVAPQSTLAATTAEKIVTGMQLTVPANSVRAGSLFRVCYSATWASTTATWKFQVRMGTAGTTSDALVIPGAATTTGTGVFLEAVVGITTIGSTGNASGYMQVDVITTAGTGGSGTPFIFDTSTSLPTVNTTVSNILSLTMTSSASVTLTNRVARIDGCY